MTIYCAVIGNPIAHSLSPIIHQAFAKQVNLSLDYQKIQVDDAQFEQQIKCFFQAGGRGLNITLPFKTRAFALAAQLTSRCSVAKAANTLWLENNQLHADNTDGVGFIRDLRRYIDPTNKRVLLLGAGGAAQGIIAPLLDAGIDNLILANRTLAKALQLQHDFPAICGIGINQLETLPEDSFDIIINATSASFAEQTIHLPNALWHATSFFYDLAYNLTSPTAFVANAHQHGCQGVDGLGMLVEQAAEAFYLWHRVMPDADAVLSSLKTLV